ncbi:hypothetical protein D7V86_10520 [bacterium D16-51]|nr:hypothetical protein D7V96_10455 [bacterium D16-59]RKI60086.1 hypothetical protein D7V86_10520 [bacterium D16-51]
MKKVLKKVIGALMVVALLMGVMAAPEQTAGASGKISTKNYNWNLEWNTTVGIPSFYYGWDWGMVNVKLKNYKITDASKKGYKKLSFTYEAVPGKDELDSIQKNCKGYYNTETGKLLKGKKYAIDYSGWFAIFDYKDGMTLETKNNHNVTVKNGKWKNSYGKLKKGKGTKYLKKSSTKVEITYPESYKNIVIAVGGFNSTETNSNKFWEGKCSFLKTEMYKKGTNGKNGKSDMESISLMRVQ